MPLAVPRLVRLVALAALVVWAGLSFAREIVRTVDRQIVRPPRAVAPVLWTWGAPQPERLRHFLNRTTGDIPAGSQVAFESPKGGSGAFYRAAWAAYYLPHLEIVPFFRREARDSDFWLIYGPSTRPEFGEPIEDRRGRLYELAR